MMGCGYNEEKREKMAKASINKTLWRDICKPNKADIEKRKNGENILTFFGEDV